MAYSYSLSKGRPAPRHRSLSLVFLLLMVLTSLREAASARSVAALAPFESVQISVPFNVKISPAGNFSLNISADQQILNAINSSVSDKVLYVGTDKPFESQQPISATILLPAGSLQQVTVLSPNNLVAVDSGFSVQALSAKVAGNLGAVILKDFGVSNFYLQGQAQSVNLDLSGVSNAASAINSGVGFHCADNLQISGSVAFPGRVSYTAGTCNLSQGGGTGRRLNQFSFLDNILGSSCQQVSDVNIPTPDLSFTCGINVSESGFASNNNGNGGVIFDNDNDGYGNGNSGNDNSGNGNSGNGNNGNGNSGNGNSNNGISIQSLPCQSSAAHTMF